MTFSPKCFPIYSFIGIKASRFKLIYLNIVTKSDADSKPFTFPKKYKNTLFFYKFYILRLYIPDQNHLSNKLSI